MTDADPLLRFRFTVRQRQVLRRIAAGQKYGAIGRSLGISEHTVRVHAVAAASQIGGEYRHLPAQSALAQFARDIGLNELIPPPYVPPDYNEARERMQREANERRAHRQNANYARLELRKAVGRGEIEKPSACSRCGRSDLRIDGHHPDYNQPLLVEWLCTSCHADEHHPSRQGKRTA